MARIRQTISPLPLRRSAFTMVELMVSIAIALVLILGINEVFKIGAQTVGAGQAFSAITRDERTAHFSFYTDIHNAMTVSQPALLITSQRTYAFNTAQDFANEPSGVPNMITINGTAQPVSNVLPSNRNFRLDTLGFFASGDLYPRQTGNDGTFVSPTTSSNAFIWYGHLVLPNNDQAKVPAGSNAAWFGPGDPDNGSQHNDNNRYASEWILGRIAMLLVPSASSGTDVYITAPPVVSPNPPTTSNNPLGYGALSSDGKNVPIYSSRYDIVAASASSFNVFNTPALRSTMMLTAPAAFAGPSTQPVSRYQADPFPVKPLSAATTAGVAPIFLNHCSQFIVEYAGDYLTQTNTPGQAGDGAVTAIQGDGQVDFMVINGQRKIRWYGFPRDTDGDGAIDAKHDVVPLRDVEKTPQPDGGGGLQAPSTASFPPWEFPSWLFAPNTNYAVPGSLDNNAQLFCSWGSENSMWPVGTGQGSSLPRMLRITLSLDDPSGRLATPQTYEYVIDLGAQQ